MLESSLFESRARTKTRKPLLVVVSVATHVMTVVMLVLIPLLQTQALTLPAVDMSLFLPRIETQAVAVFSAQARPQRRNAPGPATVFTTPTAIGTRIAEDFGEPVSIDEPYLPGGGSSFSTLPATPGGPVEAVAPEPPKPLPPPPPPPTVDARPIRRGGAVQAANLIHQVKPIYPPLARITRTQGVVVLEALIDMEGAIGSLRVLSGPPLLIEAAIDAVRQWKYRPTLLNGEPVEVITTVTVTFTLQ
jgi:periplasmic protein TonB